MKPETQRWLSKAREDLETGELLFEARRLPGCAFHAQQAAEKGLKALLIERHARFPRVHSILALMVEADAPSGLHDAARRLSAAYVAFRYPDVEQDVEEKDAAELLAAAREVLAWVLRQL